MGFAPSAGQSQSDDLLQIRAFIIPVSPPFDQRAKQVWSAHSEFFSESPAGQALEGSQ